MMDPETRASRRGPFGMVSRAWVEHVLALEGPKAAVKVAAVLAARVDRRAHSAKLSTSYVMEAAAVHRSTFSRACAVLEGAGLLRRDLPSLEEASRTKFVMWTLEGEGLAHPGVAPEAGQHVRVFKRDLVARWFAEADSGVVRTWLAHLCFLDKGANRERFHFARVGTVAKLAGQSVRTVRRNTAWLQERDVLERRVVHPRRPRLVTMREPLGLARNWQFLKEFAMPDLKAQFLAVEPVLRMPRIEDVENLWYSNPSVGHHKPRSLSLDDVAGRLAADPFAKHLVYIGEAWVLAIMVPELVSRAGRKLGWSAPEPVVSPFGDGT